MRDNTKNLLSGTVWTSIATAIEALSQIIKLAVLARFLTKEDFGVVAICNVILGLVSVFADMGFSVGVMSKKNVTQKEFSSLFWMQMFVVTILYILLSLLSPIVSSLYNTPELTLILPLSLLSLLFYGIGKLYDTIIHKEMLYKTMAIRGIVASVVSLIFSIVLCYLNCGVYSLVISAILSSLIVSIWNYAAGQRQYKLLFHFTLNEIKPFLKIGIYRMGTQICDYFSSKIDVLLIGQILGMEILGLYNLSKELVSRVYSIIVTINNKITLPLLASVSETINLMRSYFLKVVNISALISVPVFTAIVVFAEDILLLLYGAEYIEATFIMQLASIMYLVNSITSCESILVTATGRTNLDFMWTIIRVLATIVITIMLSKISIEAVVIGQLLLSVLGFFYIFRFIVNKIIRVSIVEYFSSFSKELFVGVIALLVSPILNLNLLSINSILLRIIVYGILFMLIYIIAILMFDKTNYAYIYKLIKR